MKPLKNRWYLIDYKPSKNDIELGSKPYKGIGKLEKIYKDELVFILSEYPENRIITGIFSKKDIIRKLNKEEIPPSLKELHDFWKEHHK